MMIPASFFRRRRRLLAPGQISRLVVIDADTGARRTVLEAEEIIEAPNWTPDGETLIFNAAGEIWQVDHRGKVPPVRINTGMTDLNNDHVLSPDGRTLYVSSDDGHIYAVPITGGESRRVSNTHSGPFHYYLHGVSPDGATLAYVAVEGKPARINLFTISSAGGADVRLSDIDQPNDGPEFSPDGQWIYFNSERAATRQGHAQIFRMRPDGTGIEQLTFDERVNWFPHLSPDGNRLVYLSFPEGTLSHPADRDVILRTMLPEGGQARDLAHFFGGQGTINVNSWAPDSRHFAYVEYPIAPNP